MHFPYMQELGRLQLSMQSVRMIDGGPSVLDDQCKAWLTSALSLMIHDPDMAHSSAKLD